MTNQVWLITGSSRGLGRSLAQAVLAAGHKLVATARDPKQLSPLVERYGDQVRAVALDVTDERAAAAAVQTAVDSFGRLDVLVNNAGYGDLASIEDTSMKDFRAQIETNLFGVINVTKAALPLMRRGRSRRPSSLASPPTSGGRSSACPPTSRRPRSANTDPLTVHSHEGSRHMSKNNGNTKTRTWLITGASSGLGYALAEYALQQGDRVALGARSQAAMTALAARHPDKALALALDVTNAEQRAAAVQQTEQRFGAIDVLVNNAGIDYIGAIEEQEERDYREIFEVNFFGAVSMLRLVLPGMRARKQGTIVNVSSMDGIASLPVNGFYSSSKFALEGLTESLWQEIEPIGLRAFLVEPG